MYLLDITIAGLFSEVFWRSTIVFAGCVGGLILGALVYYVFFEDMISLSGNPSSTAAGKVLSWGAVIFFILSVGLLYLDVLPAVLVAIVAMALTSLMWSIGIGMQEAGHIYSALAELEEDETRVRNYLQHTSSYRQIQELRRVGRRMYEPGSRQLKRLEEIIRETGHR